MKYQFIVLNFGNFYSSSTTAHHQTNDKPDPIANTTFIARINN